MDLEPDPEGPRTEHRSREPWGCGQGRGTARPRYLGLLLEASEGATPAGVCLAAWHLQRVDCGSPEDQPLPWKPRPLSPLCDLGEQQPISGLRFPHLSDRRKCGEQLRASARGDPWPGLLFLGWAWLSVRPAHPPPAAGTLEDST